MFHYCITNLVLILIYSGTYQMVKGKHSSAVFTVLTSVKPIPTIDLSKHISTTSRNSSRILHSPPIQKQKSENAPTTNNFFAIQSKTDKITMYFIVGTIFLTAAANLGLFLATLFNYLLPEDEEKDEKK
ncbi:hypothetical protein ACH3XW_23145 [Acanthocheilonema viteae]